MNKIKSSNRENENKYIFLLTKTSIYHTTFYIKKQQDYFLLFVFPF